MSNKYYAGIGSRQVPNDISRLMSSIAHRLAKKDMILRSGGAVGSDTAFECGASCAGGKAEIFKVYHVKAAPDNGFAAFNIVKSYHPAWNRCGIYAQALHARNAYQILGYDLMTPVLFVICWTPDGCISHQERTINTGGTGTAISIASERGIPVFNLARKDHYDRITKGLEL